MTISFITLKSRQSPAFDGSLMFSMLRAVSCSRYINVDFIDGDYKSIMKANVLIGRVQLNKTCHNEIETIKI